MFLHQSRGRDVNLLKERHEGCREGFESLLLVLPNRSIEDGNETISMLILVILREKRICSRVLGSLTVKIQIQEGVDQVVYRLLKRRRRQWNTRQNDEYIGDGF